MTKNPPRFDGAVYDPALDDERLTGQLRSIFALMKDGSFRTLPAIEKATGAPAASVSAQLRHLRKPRFGKHTINKRRVPGPRGQRGLWEYQLVINPERKPA